MTTYPISKIATIISILLILSAPSSAFGAGVHAASVSGNTYRMLGFSEEGVVGDVFRFESGGIFVIESLENQGSGRWLEFLGVVYATFEGEAVEKTIYGYSTGPSLYAVEINSTTVLYLGTVIDSEQEPEDESEDEPEEEPEEDPDSGEPQKLL